MQFLLHYALLSMHTVVQLGCGPLPECQHGVTTDVGCLRSLRTRLVRLWQHSNDSWPGHANLLIV